MLEILDEQVVFECAPYVDDLLELEDVLVKFFKTRLFQILRQQKHLAKSLNVADPLLDPRLIETILVMQSCLSKEFEVLFAIGLWRVGQTLFLFGKYNLLEQCLRSVRVQLSEVTFEYFEFAFEQVLELGVDDRF